VNYSNTIDICLATYNGAPWMAEFLDSLDAQTHTDWHLVVADDASNDGTLDLIRAHFAAAPAKLTIVERARTGEGVVQNFADAIGAARAAYVLPADQDDVWVPEKLATMLVAMRRGEQAGSVPTLVFSDLEVVDAGLETIDPSWWSHTGMAPEWALSFKTMLSQNIVPGCAMMLNRRLLELAMPMPKGVIMHDWWFLLVALAFGRVEVCSEALVRYRRHPGAHTYWNRGGILPAIRRQYANVGIIRRDYARTVAQARAFDLAFGAALDGRAEGRLKHSILRDFIRASTLGWWRKRWLCMRTGVHLVSVLQTTKFYLCI
jgi:glycosyltransferase involved in cell wall biosynthesis